MKPDLLELLERRQDEIRGRRRTWLERQLERLPYLLRQAETVFWTSAFVAYSIFVFGLVVGVCFLVVSRVG